MQRWSDEGIIINTSRFGEQSGVVRVLTDGHGLFAGMIKGAFSPRQRGVYQPGNRVYVHWQARLEDQLGHMQCELIHSCTALLLTSSFSLQLVNGLAALLLAALPERIEERIVYHACCTLLEALPDEMQTLHAYAQLEVTLLQALGFGLDLRECVATGDKTVRNLAYISPRSGRAVCREAGEPYKNRLFPLPPFLLDNSLPYTHKDIKHCLEITGYFLEQWVLLPEGKKMPEARDGFVRRSISVS